MPIEVKNVTHTYMAGSSISVNAIENINITINDGEFLGIIGHTGSGKSTFIQHLNGLVQPTSGTITVDGYDMRDKKQKVLGRRLVGMVLQYPEYQLFEETVYKDIAYGPKNMGLDEKAIDDRVREAMDHVGLEFKKFADKSPFELSGGEKRRAAIAGVIAMRPKYLVLDEPMAGLDPKGRKNILNMLESLRQATNCSIIMVSHSMDDVARSAQRIMVINEGKIAKLGSPEDVFSDAEGLVEMGLDVPRISALAIEMRKRGIDVPKNIFKAEQMLEFIKGIKAQERK